MASRADISIVDGSFLDASVERDLASHDLDGAAYVLFDYGPIGIAPLPSPFPDPRTDAVSIEPNPSPAPVDYVGIEPNPTP